MSILKSVLTLPGKVFHFVTKQFTDKGEHMSITLLPWGSPPRTWPPYMNGAPYPYLSADPSTSAKLETEFNAAWLASQPESVQALFTITDMNKRESEALALTEKGIIIDAQVCGFSSLGPKVSAWQALNMAIYLGWTNKPSLATPANQTPGMPACPWGIPGVTPTGKVPYEDIPWDTVKAPIMDLQDTVIALLNKIGVESLDL